MTQVNIYNDITIESKKAFDEFVKYINILETVSPSECERCHNKKKYTRGVLPIGKICISCRKEIKL